MTKEQLASRRIQLITELNAIGPAPAGTPAADHRTVVEDAIRTTNAAIKELNISEARRAKSTADSRKARGAAEQVANLQRSGALPPAPTTAAPAARARTSYPTPGEAVLGMSARLRKLLRKFTSPAPHTAAFLPVLSRFVADQQEFMRAEVEAAAVAAGGPVEWLATWKQDQAGLHHHRDDLACPACGTDSTVGCAVAGGQL